MLIIGFFTAEELNMTRRISNILVVLPCMVFIGLLNLTILKHFSLRFCLMIIGAMPLMYATFLDYSGKARILEKDGGFWRFRHQELQDYFAKLP